MIIIIGIILTIISFEVLLFIIMERLDKLIKYFDLDKEEKKRVNIFQRKSK